MENKDLVNQRFGKLMVLEYIGNSNWKCQCDCGNITIVTTSHLQNGNITSCGCSRSKKQNHKIPQKTSPRKNLAGQRFGKLIAIRYMRGGKWLCQCDCGKSTIVDTRNLNSKHTLSCGCMAKENSKNTYDMNGYENEGLKVLKRAGSSAKGTALWECLCKYCGRTFITRGSAIRRGETASCGCVHSMNEQKIIRLLSENKINFQTQYTFSDLKGENGGALRFDFAIFNKDGSLSHLIEYNGQQHYIKAEGRWGKSFEIAKKNDAKKIHYCHIHNIPLIIIRFDKKYDLKTLLGTCRDYPELDRE